VDTTPRAGTNDTQKRHLQRLADVIVDEMELRREVQVRARREDQLEEARRAAEEVRRTAERERQAAEAAQQEAEEARAEAEEANAAMARFFAGIAHDLQTPLTRIQLFADLLKKSLDDPDNRYIRKIHTSSDRMSAMVESLQDLAQVRSGQVVVDPEPSDVAGIAASACQAYQPDAADAGCALETDLPDEPACAAVDPDSLRRVVDNLLRNALQYSGDGDRVTVSVESAEETVCLSVVDTGPGIPEETLDTLFEPFTRGDNDGDGMGLGLAVSKDLVEAMDGRITVDSEPGEGTRFDVIVPTTSPDR
jgi:signal transduction histidine kinase